MHLQTMKLCGTEPIECAHLLRKVDGELIALLRGLRDEEWEAQTVAPQWCVRDVAAHLLDTCLRKLAMVRDACYVEKTAPRSAEELVQLVNRLNAEGVAVYRRLSSPLLIEMMTMACMQAADFHESLDPFAPAVFGVSWAGELSSLNWFDTARELTERWHHQQQIRLATGRDGTMTRELYHPVLDCFLRGLPHACRNVNATAGASILVEIAGECGGVWLLAREAESWHFVRQKPDVIGCRVVIPQAIAWRVFTKGIDRRALEEQVAIEGDRRLADAVLGLTAIVG
jgi:uncharacterized protein (TIGR03083 family)